MQTADGREALRVRRTLVASRVERMEDDNARARARELLVGRQERRDAPVPVARRHVAKKVGPAPRDRVTREE